MRTVGFRTHWYYIADRRKKHKRLYLIMNTLKCDPSLLKKDLTGQVIIITGANRGLGYETAKQIAKQGATVVLACRNLSAAKKVSSKLTGLTYPMHLDLGTLSSVKTFGFPWTSKLPDSPGFSGSYQAPVDNWTTPRITSSDNCAPARQAPRSLKSLTISPWEIPLSAASCGLIVAGSLPFILWSWQWRLQFSRKFTLCRHWWRWCKHGCFWGWLWRNIINW